MRSADRYSCRYRRILLVKPLGWVGVAELRIIDLSVGSTGRRRVEIVWRDGVERRMAVAEFGDLPDDGYEEKIRWYLEDYAEFPADPAPAIARDAEARMARVGAELFGRVFSNADAAAIWERVWDRLDRIRVEVDADPDAGPELPWELLRDPVRDAAVALSAGEFIRTHLRASRHPALQEPAGDRLRVLLVICRPDGGNDVPFRSVASQLVRGGAEQMEGLDLEVLRPATFSQLSRILDAAYDAGRPYHIVHFDGHGGWLDLTDMGITAQGIAGRDQQGRRRFSVAGPVRPGPHGYLVFEDPGTQENYQLVDGPILARLLAGTGVPVLVLDACRSAYSEARSQPDDAPRPDTEDEGRLEGDGAGRIRAYGSLAAEVADAGVPGVVAMRYNVWVVTAAQYMADLYAHLLAGQSLGQAATAARRALAADPVRQIGAAPVALQDWAVPVVYEAAPLVLLRPPDRAAPLIRLAASGGLSGDAGEAGPQTLPEPPAAGFFGRDEALLALDRMFDTNRVVLLHALAGAGKSATAAEFARWYQVTGGLNDPQHPERGPGTVLWSSFEHHLTADRVISAVGDHFADLLEANGVAWSAVTDSRQRRDIAMQVLSQLPVLWVWDNVEPVTGFPAGSASVWTPGEQDDLAELLRDLAQRTRCKVLLASRRDERAWLGDLPARVWLPWMRMRESLQLAAALAARHGRRIDQADWRPLLRYTAGNPLTITVVVGQALRENLTSTEAIDDFLTRLQAGQAQLEAGEDAMLGRAQSLHASLSYGFAHAFTDAERAQLAVLHLFRDTVIVGSLRYMGESAALDQHAVPELADLSRDAAIELLDRAAEIGLLTSLGGEYYEIHPALPWYFASLFAATYGQSGEPAADRAARAYAMAIGDLAFYRNYQSASGSTAEALGGLRTQEANLLHALDLARTHDLWQTVTNCLKSLQLLYERAGRDGEIARMVAAAVPDCTDPDTGGPLADHKSDWITITDFRAWLAADARDWPTAIALRNALIAFRRDEASAALASPMANLDSSQRISIRNLASEFSELGTILCGQGDPGCLPYFMDALALMQKIGDKAGEGTVAIGLGNVYLAIPGLEDLDQAEQWFHHSLRVTPGNDRRGQSLILGSLGGIAARRFAEARVAGETGPHVLKYLNAALGSYQQSLSLTPDDDHQKRGGDEHQLGIISAWAGRPSEALKHFQQAIKHHEVCGDIYQAGSTRFNIAVLLAGGGRAADALHYARAALDNFRQYGPGATSEAAKAERIIARLEQQS